MLIDLDAPGPPPDPGRRPRSRSRALPLLLAAALLALLGASASASAADLRLPVAAVSGPRTVDWLLTDRAFYSAHTRAGSTVVDVTARSLDGPVQWTRSFESDGMIPKLRLFGPHLAVEFTGVRMSLLDAATGDIRLGQLGLAATGDGILIWDSDARFGLLDPVAGRIVWQRATDNWPMAVTNVGGRVQVVNADGTGAVYDRDTGATLRTGSGLNVVEETFTTVVTDGWLFVLTGHEVTAVRMRDLRRMWTAPAFAVVAVNRCGEAFCASGAAGTTAFDPESGRILWSSAQWASWSGDYATSGDGRLARLDPATGAVRADLGRSRPAGALLVRPGGVVTEPSTGRLRGLLTNPGVAMRCDSGATHIACQFGDTTTVWKLA